VVLCGRLRTQLLGRHPLVVPRVYSTRGLSADKERGAALTVAACLPLLAPGTPMRLKYPAEDADVQPDPPAIEMDGGHNNY